MKDLKRSLPPLVLVIEDRLEWGESLQGLLLQEGFRTAVARDGLEGLTLAESMDPDLILLTLALPVMDGLEFLQQYRHSFREKGKRARIIALSSIPSYLHQALDLGADWAFRIPMDRNLILDSV
ncbi:MAG: response regulator, partial [Bdellovibrionales bacterium]|nr:response regulator [Bdellovibrionales bacterium]